MKYKKILIIKIYRKNLFILYKNHELKIDDYGKKLSSKQLNGKFQNIKIWSDIKENNKKCLEII